MTNADLVAHAYLRACWRELLDALDRGATAKVVRALQDRDDFLEANPRYDDGTYRPVD